MNSNSSKKTSESKISLPKDIPHSKPKKLSLKTTSNKDIVSNLLSKASKPNSTLIKSCHSFSKEGKDDSGNPKRNQDTYLIIRDLLIMENVNIFAVMDGHGEHGDQVSGQIKRFFLSQFNNHKLLLKVKTADEFYSTISANNFDFLKQLFKEAEKSLSKCNIDFQLSGTTCVMVIQVNKRIICANVGDSRCIIINESDAKALSRDHKPDIPEERQRIEEKGGEIAQFEENGVKGGPLRIWKKGHSYPGIAMSRSIGDEIASGLGVVCEPEIMEWEVKGDAKAMVLASDGVWEFLDAEKVREIVLPFHAKGNTEGACSAVIKKATECWLGEDACVDDITVIMVFF